MLLLSVDDYLLPGALSRATGLMDVHPEVGFTFGNTIELSDSGTETPSKTIIKEISDSGERILEEREFIELSGAGNLVATCSAVVRTELQNAWADIAMSCRTRATWKCGCVLPRTRRLALFPHVRAFIDAIAPTYRQHTIFFWMVVKYIQKPAV